MYNEHTPIEFDPEKERKNIQKHGIDFETASQVFRDPELVIAPDGKHSGQEQRWFAVGQVSDGRVITVWHTKRGDKIRIIGAAELRKWRDEYEKRKFAGSEHIKVG